MNFLATAGLASLREENRRLRALVEFGRQMMAERDLRAQLRLLCSELRRTTGCAAAAVILRDPEHGAVAAIESEGLAPAVDGQWQQAVRAALIGAEADVRPPDLVRGSATPLRVGDQELGTVLTFDHEPGVAVDVGDYFAVLADAAAMAIFNTRLYGEQHSRLEEMIGLQRLGTLLLEEHDFDRVLQSICQQLQRLTDAGGVGLALLEEDPRFLEMRTVVGPSADVLRGARIPTEGSFAAEALRTNRSQRSDDAQNDPRGYKTSLILGNTRTILSVPMKTRQRTVGVLSVYNKEGAGGFTERDAELATFFANQAAAAIENARLYEQTREYAVVEERNRLARELHDSVTQSLFSVTLLSEAALSLLDRDPAKARERLERASELAEGALAEMRALIFQLRPMTLQEEGLISALKKHLTALHSRHGRVVELRVTGAQRRLAAPVEDAAFGIIQESLNNVVKHAGAARAQVQLDFGAEALGVTTMDTGLGFDPAAPRSAPTLGMSSMRERAEGIGGRLVVRSAPGQGTRISAHLPIRHAD